jgi:hypothetical protein
LIPTMQITERAGRLKFELQPLSGYSSPGAATKIRIELPESSLHARGREIGFRPYFLIQFRIDVV